MTLKKLIGLLFYSACLTQISSTKPNRCPDTPKCFCTSWTGGYKVDCSGQGLSTVPRNLPVNTLELILTDNPIIRLSNHSFIHLTCLKKLVMKNTSLEHIDLEAFTGLGSLMVLNLCDNKQLNVYRNGLQTGMFKPLRNLTHLIISNNTEQSGDGQSYPCDVMQDLPALREWVIDGVSESPFEDTMRNLSHLNTLSMSGFAGVCELKHIGRDFFSNIPHLRFIYLRNCKIENIHRDAFRPLYRIRKLDLSFNIQLGLDGFEEASKGLANSTIHELILNKLYPTFGMGIELKISYIQWLSNTKLEILELNSNRLEKLEFGALHKFPSSISHLAMGDNKFTYGLYMWEFGVLTKLKYLDVSRMFSSHFIKTVLGEIDTRCFTTCNREPTQVISRSIINQTVDKLPFWPVPEFVKFINISHSGLRYKIPEIHGMNNSLERLDLSSNALYSWQGPVTGLDRLLWLDISNNLCSNVSRYFFDNMPKLTHLFLDDNLLSDSLEDDIEGDIFKKLVLLRNLTIRSNRIHFLNENSFHNLHNLLWLDLSDNRLRNLTIFLGSMQSLTHLDLRSNFLTELPENIRSGLDQFGSRIEVLLEGNPLECSCTTFEFIKWISSTSVNIVSKKKLFCSVDGSYENFESIQAIIEFLERSCRDYTPFILVAAVGLLLSVIAISAMALYRYRWQLRYLYYVSRAKFLESENADSRTFSYDCFISYAEEDRMFVKNDVIDELEKKSNLKLCVHGRDFIPGKSIQQNISSAIYNSRKCIFLLSKHFLESYWCLFEYNMARVEEMHSGRDILILVNFRYVPTHTIPAEIWEQMEVATYITYHRPPQETLETIFWTNIKKALSQ